ncbi:MAG TPA: alpha/beta hydrolase [Myxococcota bacterium]|nr:alpha/beta hydrolase [Myxococcota bacterium]
MLVGSVGPGIEKRATLPEPLVEFLAGPGLSWISSVPPLWRRFHTATSRVAFSPDPVPNWYLTQLEANFARPHTLDTFRSEGRDLGGEADLDPNPIEVPMLVIQGDEDRLIPRAIGEEIHTRAPQSTLQVIPHAGHMLPITHAALLADAIANFVAHDQR